jgi:hypothetical protein
MAQNVTPLSTVVAVPVNIVKGKYVSTEGLGVIFANSTQYRIKVTNIIFSNITSSNQGLKVRIGGTYVTGAYITLFPGHTFVIEEYQIILNLGDSIEAQCIGDPNSITVSINGEVLQVSSNITTL